MAPQALAKTEVEARLGADALDDGVWQDLRLFDETASKLVYAAWDLSGQSGNQLYQVFHPQSEADRRAHDQCCDLVVGQLQARLGHAAACRAAAVFLLHPQFWPQPSHILGYGDSYYRRQALCNILQSVAERLLSRQQPPDWLARVGRRLHDLCSVGILPAHSGAAGPADFRSCIAYLLALDEAAVDQRVRALLDALTDGSWHKAWRAIGRLAGQPGGGLWNMLEIVIYDGKTGRGSDSDAAERLKVLWQPQAAHFAVTLLARLDTQEQLEMSIFRRLLESSPGSLPALTRFVYRNPSEGAPAGTVRSPWLSRLADVTFGARLRSFVDAVVWEMICDFRPETWPALLQIEHLSGGRSLLRLAEEVQQRGLAKLHGSNYGSWYAKHTAETVLAALLSKLRRDAGDDGQTLVGCLRQLDVAALLAILPHARAYEAEVCAALGWDGSLALAELLHRMEATNPAASTDPSAGVVQRAAILEVVEHLGEEHTRILLDAFAHHLPGATTLCQAALGWNRSEVRRLFGRRKPLAARALPLLPFEKGDTVLKRYLALTSFQREANTSGAGRKALERAAAEAGLANLALHAGFADATRMEWAMQEQIGLEGMSLGRAWEIEGYTLALVERDGQPVLEVRKEQRRLKRVPAAVSRDYVYREVRTALDLLKDQRRRYCQAFLNAMRRGDQLSAEELAILRRNPLAVALLERLVLRDAAGACGLFRAADNSLEGYHDDRVPITGAVSIAHPYDLAQDGTLGDWQNEIVRRQIVQPFKQVFRELYLLTPAESQAEYSSSRFAGRRLKGRQSTAVLANLGWLVGDGYAVSKPFYDLGFAASFETGTYAYYGDDDFGGTTGALTFWPLGVDHYEYYRQDRRERRIRLADVPPRLLSEVLRDLDLVTVVAHQSDEHGSSREVLSHRGDLVRATIAALGLKNVEVDEPHIRVQGSRACYRIHLATAAIHVESGSYLCIVPTPKARKATYLPFEDGGDPVSSELVSKVLLLANDRSITDPTILAQIPPARRAA